MTSPVPNNATGIANSRLVRTRRHHDRLWEFYEAIVAIDNDDGLALTNKGIALQLNAKGLETRGMRGTPGKFNGARVGEHLEKLGIDRRRIERWKKDARLWGLDHGVSGDVMVGRLWEEWSWHVRRLIWDKFVPIHEIAAHPLDLKPLFTDNWTPPAQRYPDSNAHRRPASLPHEKIVRMWLGKFDIEDDEKPSRKQA